MKNLVFLFVNGRYDFSQLLFHMKVGVDMDINETGFGKLSNGREAVLYTLCNQQGTTVKITDYGARIVAWSVKDKDDHLIDIVLGYEDAKTYEKDDKYMGAIIGRCANRIGNAEFALNGKIYHLDKNDGNNHLHGGFSGFDKKIWSVRNDSNCLMFTIESCCGEGGYPGNLKVSVGYLLTDDNQLLSEYKAISDSDTLFNPTNHTYFNLNGFDGSNILNQEIQIFADYYTWSNDAAIPDGRILPVEGTPMDLRKLTTIGRHIDADFDELNYGHGYDHNWCINIVGNECISVLGSPLYRAAHAESKSSGIALTVHTDMPGIQFYTGNFLDGNLRGKNGVRFRHRQGFCLETQYYPNAVNNAKFPQPVLSGSIEWSSKTLYSIGRKLETKISDE